MTSSQHSIVVRDLHRSAKVTCSHPVRDFLSLLGVLHTQGFWARDGNRKWHVLLFNFSWHNHIYVIKAAFTQTRFHDFETVDAAWKYLHTESFSPENRRSWWYKRVFHYVPNSPFWVEQCKFRAKVVTVFKSVRFRCFARQMKAYRFENAPLLAAFSNRPGLANALDRCRLNRRRNRIENDSCKRCFRQRLHERGFTSTWIHDFETTSKSMRFGGVYTEPFSPENPSSDGISERCATCWIHYFELNSANFAPK